ncbi:ankyrin repeat domain-containing protein [Treponema sp. Marseille-Q4130]|uniref:ankyrin repeat domain-containing protein n=1 Tax=Treponema sp. Marseille-Q4130 TaxID=2766702 RepID=UPI0016524BD5|nr:ankyrin repeat domain-containing protein [Treponema sp. Marseille-Q4130]MBC6719417.1 ankyrin repeat domain-containing protein [Treponema sp. Marseille-Q4130]
MKVFFRILFVMAFFPLAAAASDTYPDLVQSGTAQQIKRAFLFDGDAPTRTIGKERNNLLIMAIIHDREEDIINVLLKAGIGVDEKNREKRTAVSYACEYCSAPSTFRRILGSGRASEKKIHKRLMTRDKKGRYAASYAETNPAVREIVTSYLNENDIALLEQTTEGGVPLLSAAANIERPAESTEAVLQAAENAKIVLPTAEKTPEAQAQNEDSRALSEMPVTDNADVSASDGTNDAASENEDTAVPEKSAAFEKPASAEADAVPLPPPVLLLPAVRPSASHGKTFLYDYADAPSDSEDAAAETVQSETIIKNVNMQDEKGVTPLMFAIKSASVDLTRTLLKSGADVNARDKEGWTPLMYAVRVQNDSDLVSMLIDAGASVRAKNSYGVSSLLIAAEYSENPDVVSLLLDSYSATESETAKAFIHTITSSNVPLAVQCEKIRCFIDKGVPINAFWEGKTPLMYAASAGRSTAVIETLLEAGALPSARTASGLRAFDFAQKNQALEHDDIYRSLNADN